MRSQSLRLLFLVVASFAVVVAVPAHAGNPASSGVAVGFARVRLSDGAVTAFGGKGTKSVTTGPTVGGIIVFFDGSYPKKLAREQVVVQATAEAGGGGEFGVANAIVADADNHSISITVNAWESASHAALDGYVFLIVYAGVPPKT